MTTVAPDLNAIKEKQQATWASGDYAVIGSTLQIVGESLCEAVDVHAGWRVLDVAAGNGNASLAAARRGCDVVATDYVTDLLEGTQRRAAANGLRIDTQFADAENLPFDDASFDAVLSTFGVMFVPDPDRAATEMLRVVRRAGRIGLANWTPEGFIGQMFKIVGAHVPPPAGIRSPLQWGTDDRLYELFGSEARLAVTRKHFVFRYASPEAWLKTFVTYYGPTFKAWGALDDAGKESFRTQLIALADEHNTATDGTMTVPGEYVEVVVEKG
jgi:ubiquinone/menaquinone biosynthesis C-methylase UbiE